MMVQMLGVFAEFERATIIDRVIAGMERKTAKGGWCGDALPYGYNVDKDSDFLTVNEHQAPLVTRIFDLYTRRRLGARAIANWLNEHGHRTKAGRPWSHVAVLTVLRNRSYLGEVYFRGTFHPAPHPALVDADTFDKAQQILGDRSEHVSHRASNSSEYLLGGLVTCNACGKRFLGNADHGRNGRHRYYTCFSRNATAPTPAPPTGCQRASSTSPSSTRCSPPTNAPTCSTASPTMPPPAHTPPHNASAATSPTSKPNSTRPSRPSNATCSPSRPAPCPKPTAANECAPSAARSPTSATARPNCKKDLYRLTRDPAALLGLHLMLADRKVRIVTPTRPDGHNPNAAACSRDWSYPWRSARPHPPLAGHLREQRP